MTQFQADPHHVYAAAHGSADAQRDLAAAMLWHAEAISSENPGLADEYLMSAELMAEMAFAHCDAFSVATLAAVSAIRSLHCPFDPVRSFEYREEAERLFDVVEGLGGDSRALATIGVALNRLADADPDDDRAAMRLGRVVAALPPGEACLLREAVRPAARQPALTVTNKGD